MLADEGCDIGLRRRERGQTLVFARARFRVLEGERGLVDQSLAALGALAVQLAAHLLVLKRQQRVARGKIGGLCDRLRGVRLGAVGTRLGGRERAAKRRKGRGQPRCNR